ncbi:MAG: Gfo/Idh/MocA family oxidoreductase [Epsilonproteobacteria bacterium]|nr:Gfo/Idh/MocA family oxidoreductase [Campylobacterota bacterium]
MRRIAIVGLGAMGKNHYRTLKNISNVQIVGLCDVVKNGEFDEPFFTDLDEMIVQTQPEAIIIVTPTFLHKNIALICAKHDIHMFIEKPAASHIQDAREMLDAINKKGLKSCVGHIERFNPVVKTLIDQIGNDEILFVSIDRSGPFPSRIADVGILIDLSVHDSDLIRFITKKEIVNVSVHKSQKIHKTHEDNAIIGFTLEGNVLADIMTNWLTPFRKREIHVTCRSSVDSHIRYLEANLLNQTLKEYVSTSPNSFSTTDHFVKRSDALYDELSAFIEYLNSGKRGTLATIEDSIVTLEIASK